MQSKMDRTQMESLQRLAQALPREPLYQGKALSHCLKGAGSALRRYDRENARFNQKNAVDRDFFASYSTWRHRCLELKRQLRPIWLPSRGKGELPGILLLIQAAMEQEDTPFTQEYTEHFLEVIGKHRPLCNAELVHLPMLIQAAALIQIAKLAGHGQLEEQESRFRAAAAAFTAAGALDTEALIGRFSQLERILRQDPAGVYDRQDERTRAMYRYRCAEAARLSGAQEEILARKLLRQAKRRDCHIGYPLEEVYAEYRPKNPIRPDWFRLLFFVPAVCALLLSGVWQNPLWALLFYWPCYEICRPFLERAALWRSDCPYAPRLDWQGCIPQEHQTLLVLPVLLPREEQCAKLREHLLSLMPTAKDGAVALCLLCDLAEAGEAVLPADRKEIRAVKRMVRELNRTYGERVILLVRPRTFSKTQGSYTGKERKRGAILTLLSLLNGNPQPLEAFEGPAERLYGSKHLLVLDEDTRLTVGALPELVSIAAHPMNRPVIDETQKRVVKGYGVLIPHLAAELRDVQATWFGRLFGGDGGTATYGEGVPELYQSLFQSSIFSGKGLLDVEACWKCLPNRFEEETVLSHDILEGGLLRARYIGDIELIDGFPTGSIGYLRRLSRWIRGDMQNSPFLFPRVRQYHGNMENPLPKLTRFQLFDNIRRAFLPVAGMACILGGAGQTGFRALACLLLGGAAVAAPFFAGCLDRLFRRIRHPSPRIYTGWLPRSGMLLLRGFAHFLLLPQLAWNAGVSTAKGLWRRLVSRRKLLEWVPSSRVKPEATLAGRLRFFLPQLLCGLCFLLFPSWWMKGSGALFLLAVFSAGPAGRMRREPAPFSAVERDSLLSDMRRMLSWFEEYATKKEHYLPPDNVQEAPRASRAHRTSPTNIGLMLLSYLAARDCGLLSTARLVEAVGNTLATLEELSKFHGNLYNWYDTRTLDVLPPAFVSSVDSGNFFCCLTALKEGLREYAAESGGALFLVARIEELLAQGDLSVFYDRRRKLFSIGWDSEKQSLSPYHYDMLMSEARMTSYYAVARGQVEYRHWRALSRALAKAGPHIGPLSWTGTMFEYFMPELLLHCPRGSLGYSGLAFCVYSQKKRTAKMGLPWGVSESGIYSFDGELHYQYRPNGVQRAALKPGMDQELVVSPYSSYLALLYAGSDALANLERIKQMGGYGKYGFYEALDFTPARTGGNPYEIVKSQMAHHLGMSICAIANALKGNCLQKRFCRDFDMRRSLALLEEQMPEGDIRMPDWEETRNQKRAPEPAEQWDYCGPLSPARPKVKLLANSELCSVLTDVGSSYLRQGKLDLTRRPDDLLRAPVGSYCFVRDGEQIFSLTFAPSYQKGISYETAFSSGHVRYTAKTEGLSAGMEVRLHRNLPCEQRTVTLQNRSTEEKEVTLLFYLEPSLFPRADDDSHKAFSKLFLRVEKDTERNAAVATRKQRDNREGRALACGFRDGVDFTLIPSREKVFCRPDVSLPNAAAFTKPFMEQGGVPDPCMALRVTVRLKKGETHSLTLLSCVGQTRSQALVALSNLRAEEAVGLQTESRSRWEEGTLEERISRLILPQVLFSRRDSSLQLGAVRKNRLPVTRLWELGISADFPIVLCEVASAGDMGRVRAYAVCHALASLSFVEYDLVFLYEGAPETREAIRAVLADKGGLDRLGSRAGIHLVNGAELSSEMRCLLTAAACHTAARSFVRIEPPVRPYLPLPVQPVKAAAFQGKPDLAVQKGAFCGDSFFVTGRPALPWCHILANPTFGAMVSDRALGFTWAVNSRELKLTPWHNDAMRDNRGEMLLLKGKRGCYDLVCGAQAEFHPSYAKYRGEADGIRTTVTVRIPEKGMIKYLEVELSNQTEEKKELSLSYYLEPCLGVNRQDAAKMTGGLRGGALLLHNPFCRAGNAYLALSADQEPFDYACDRPEYLCGRWAQNTPPPMQDLCAAVTVKKTLPPHKSCRTRFLLSFSTTQEGALALLQIRPEGAWHPEGSLRIKSRNPALDAMVNTWIPWQVFSSRLFGRTGFYQNGGAYGFRDQLQDAGNILLLAPTLLRTHLIRCAAMQFAEGDVMHWWHALPRQGGGRRGVRTRYSDDLLFLPYMTARYVRWTGDSALLQVPVRYLQAEELKEGQKDSYGPAVYTDWKESVYEHCKRALERAYRLGRHGLPKMGGGDWNDGYNQVGAKGEGESIWLAQFLALVYRDFAPLCRACGEDGMAQRYENRADELLNRVDLHAWDGNWYLRAFYDDGSRMGSRENDECRIDSLPQSFAVLSGMPNRGRLLTAMDAAYGSLVDEKGRIIRLFDPPFSKGEQEPGYVKAYPEGVRENGGQYTHAAVWFAMAAARLGQKEKFFTLASLLNPALRCLTQTQAEAYGLEPYAMPADVYTNPDAYGRGGWSLYTGAAGWYYRLLTEELLGLSFSNSHLTAAPRLPYDLERVTVGIRFQQQRYSLTLTPGQAPCDILPESPEEGGESPR